MAPLTGWLRDQLGSEEPVHRLGDARQMLGLWLYEYNNFLPRSSLGNRTPGQGGRACERDVSITRDLSELIAATQYFRSPTA